VKIYPINTERNAHGEPLLGFRERCASCNERYDAAIGDGARCEDCRYPKGETRGPEHPTT
jgi:hypothetical protein